MHSRTCSAGLGDGAQIVHEILPGHTDTSVAELQDLVFLVERDLCQQIKRR